MKKSIWKRILGGFFVGGRIKLNGKGFEFSRMGFGYIGKVYKWEGAGIYFYLIKKHYCERCDGLLEKREESTFEEDYEYGMTETSIIGPAKIIRHFFYCTQCEKKYTAKELKEAERRKKNLTLKD